MESDVGLEGLVVHLVYVGTDVVAWTIGGKATDGSQAAYLVKLIDIFDAGLEEQGIRIIDSESLIEFVFHIEVVAILEGIFDDGIFIHDVGDEDIFLGDASCLVHGLDPVFFGI